MTTLKLPRKTIILVAVWAIPFLVNAQNIETIGDVITAVGSLINSLIPIAASLALLAFFLGLAKYIFQAGNKDAKEQGQRIMIAGVASLFLIAAIGGIIEIFAESLDINTGTDVPVPGVGTGG
jgi:hypothetical protein